MRGQILSGGGVIPATRSTDDNYATPVVVKDTVTVRQEIEMAAIQEYDRFTLNSATPVDTWDISHMDEVTVEVASDGTTDTVKISTSADGENFDEISPVGRNAADGSYLSAAALKDNKVTIPFNARKLRFTASGTTDTFTISWSARNSGRGTV
jgi:hypothetical protein